MVSLIKSQLSDLDEIVNIDREVIGSDGRRKYIKKAIEEERCIAIKNEFSFVGFLIYDIHFFDCSFISLIIVKPTERRKGYATCLIDYFISISPTKKIFSSTNQSNKRMQEVFKENGFIQSGYVENLDDGDPEIIYFKST
ncbi:GNAT family N-acetyltransferase [Sporosarcina thermotolerans]|uniref:GNAT family N-acetyltransferase n=1 Tax=Sporosarcina thermotolerans TaxID=633404 RepID=A0AAW9AAX4_9BACL|nr:GNAT family N-acetyltransferase [Sporosarcina thermotolerans]MDW0118647.1 GNAT family N-acetyltransferase [Sporosarcina thermotolerans]WHT49561.1 GNAT family N-acetyltransferase [Sporosarcina thermotolerans]